MTAVCGPFERGVRPRGSEVKNTMNATELNDQRKFKLTHGSATLEKTLAAAARVEAVFGCFANGEKRALNRLSMEDVALLVQFPRDAARQA